MHTFVLTFLSSSLPDHLLMALTAAFCLLLPFLWYELSEKLVHFEQETSFKSFTEEGKLSALVKS